MEQFKMGYIYKITSPSGKIYIGQTKSLKNREYYYKKNLCKKQPKLYNSLIKYGWVEHVLEIIDSCTIETNKKELDEKEKYWIKFYDSHHNGLNCNDGGQGHLGRKQSPEHVAKRVEFLKLKGRGIGRTHSEETKIKMSISKTNDKNIEKITEKRIKTMNENNTKPGNKLNFKHSKETKLKISQSNIGKQHSEETKNKIRKKILENNKKKKEQQEN